MQQRCWVYVLQFALAGVGVLAAAVALQGRAAAPAAKPVAARPVHSSDDELLQLFLDTLDQVERNHVKGLSRRELIEAAIQGMLAKLDAHTRYIAPRDLDRFRLSVENEFPGIGVRLSLENARLTIVSALPDTPADRAGLVAGDVITHIQDEPTEKLTLGEALQRLKGESGSQLVLRVAQPGGGPPETVTLTRASIRMETVLGDRKGPDARWEYMYDADCGIGYVRLIAFGRHTADDLRKAIDALRARNMRGLVLDLRFNAGGLLTSAVSVADLFIAAGRIVSTRGRSVQEQVWDAHRPGTYEDFPLAVLVNQYTASASEIVAACLQDHRRAIVVGQRTYGKGSVQDVVELEGGSSALKLTTASYHRPSGKNIDRGVGENDAGDWGVRPDPGWEIKLADVAASHLFTLRRARDIFAAPNHSSSAPAYQDEQLAKALSYLREKLKPAQEAVPAPRESAFPASQTR